MKPTGFNKAYRAPSAATHAGLTPLQERKNSYLYWLSKIQCLSLTLLYGSDCETFSWYSVKELAALFGGLYMCKLWPWWLIQCHDVTDFCLLHFFLEVKTSLPSADKPSLLPNPYSITVVQPKVWLLSITAKFEWLAIHFTFWPKIQ